MQAIFRPNHEYEIGISDQPATLGVILEVYQTKRHITPEDVDRNPIEPGRVQILCLQLSRADARSIASAMMGAAAKQS